MLLFNWLIFELVKEEYRVVLAEPNVIVETTIRVGYLITLLELQQDECGCRTFVWITIKRWPTEAKLLMSDHKAKLNVAVNYLQDIYRGGRLLLFFQETRR